MATDTKDTKSTYNSTIPCDWEVRELIQVANYVDYRGKTPSKKDAGRFLVTARNIKSGQIDYETSQEFISENDYQLVMRRGLPKIGDILITTEAPLGSIAMINNEDIALAQRIIKYRVKENIINNYYLLYYLSSAKFQQILDLKSTGSTAKGIKGSVLHKLPIEFPPLPEQKAIAHILGLMDNLINKNDQLITQKELRKKWLMQNLLTGKKRLRGFDGKWKDVKLGNVFDFIKSYSISRDGLTKSNVISSKYCIHYGDIHAFYESNFLDFSRQAKIPQIVDETQIISKNDYLKDGDIIMADASEDYLGVGAAIEVLNLKNNIAVGGLHTIVLRGNPSIITNGFKSYVFSSEPVRNKLRKMATGTSVYSVTKTTLNNLIINIPASIKEQTAIAQVLQAADKEIELLKAKAAKLREQKKGMMQVLLTGKKRLKLK